MTYDVTMTSLLKQWQNSDLRETRQIIYHSTGNDESFPKIFIEIESPNQSYGHSCKIFAYFSQFLPDLSLIILISRKGSVIFYQEGGAPENWGGGDQVLCLNSKGGIKRFFQIKKGDHLYFLKK